MDIRLPIIIDTKCLIVSVTVMLFAIMLTWIWTLKFEMIAQKRQTDYFHKKYDEVCGSLTEHVAKCESSPYCRFCGVKVAP